MDNTPTSQQLIEQLRATAKAAGELQASTPRPSASAIPTPVQTAPTTAPSPGGAA